MGSKGWPSWHHTLYSDPRRRLRAVAAAFAAVAMVSYISLWSSMGPKNIDLCLGVPAALPAAVDSDPRHLVHIPPKIWQIYLDFPGASPVPMDIVASRMFSWVWMSPSHTYRMLDDEAALAIVSQQTAAGPGRPKLAALFEALTRPVLRADFLRYLLLAVEGGVYSDTDTVLVQPVHLWVPDEFKEHTRLIVGLEADALPPINGTTYPVQFSQWTLAGAAGHPAFWAMVDRIVSRIDGSGKRYSDNDVLTISGPAGWTEVVFKYLSDVSGTNVTWRNLTGMQVPRLIGDVLVLPIDGFATGVPHSNASAEITNGTMAMHLFDGSWRNQAG